MSAQSRSQSGDGSENRRFWIGILRGFGGALLFSIPILLTMEMWWLGFYVYRWRLILMLVLMLPALIFLAHFAGIRAGTSWRQDVIDGIVAYAIGLITAVVTLMLLGIVTVEMPMREIVGKIMVQAPTSAFGAILARSQLGAGGNKQKKKRQRKASYWAELFFVAAGAFYVASTVGSTMEMPLLAMKMTEWHAVVLLLVELALMHAILYSMQFSGSPEVPKGTPWWSTMIRFTLPGYVIALAVSAYLLWTFGRFETFDPQWMLMFTIILGLPATLGGAAGRLII